MLTEDRCRAGLTQFDGFRLKLFVTLNKAFGLNQSLRNVGLTDLSVRFMAGAESSDSDVAVVDTTKTVPPPRPVA